MQASVLCCVSCGVGPNLRNVCTGRGFTIKRNKWFILYKGVLLGFKRGDFRARPS